MALTLSGGPLAMPDDLRFRRLRLQNERGQVRRRERMRYRSDHLAAVLLDDLRGVVFQRMAEGVVGGHEEPGVAAAFDDFLRGADRKRMGVEHPLHGIGRAELAVEIGRAGRMGDEQLVAVVGDVLHRQANRRHRHVDDEIDLFDVVPLLGDAGGDVRLDLVVGGNNGDRLAQDFAAKILDRHLRGRHRSRSGRGRGRPGQIGQHADFHDVVGDLRPGAAAPAQPGLQKRQQERWRKSLRNRRNCCRRIVVLPDFLNYLSA